MSFAESSPGTGESTTALAGSDRGLLLFAHQSVPPAPGREAGVSQPAPPPAGEPAAAPGGLGGMLPLLIMVLPMILLLFFSSRSQQKKQAAALANLKKGDRVLTESGIVGRLIELGDRYAKLEISPGVKIEVLRTRLAGADTFVEPQTTAEKK